MRVNPSYRRLLFSQFFLRLCFTVLVACCFPFGALLCQPRASINVTEFSLPGGNKPSALNGITAGPDGALWFATGTFDVGRITTHGTVTMFPVPSDLVDGSEPYGITTGADGAVWFTEYSAGKIGRLTTSGSLSEYKLKGSEPTPTWITSGPDGALWFAEPGNNTIGRITMAGVITEYSLPLPDSSPNGITAGPDGAVWFTETNAGKIGRITTNGALTEFSVPVKYPDTIAAGSDGALWFTANYYIGRMTTDGALTLYNLSGDTGYGITSGPDGALWFTAGYNRVGRITVRGVVTFYDVTGGPFAIASGPDGALWFTQNNSNTIGRVPACGLGFRATLEGNTVSMNFDLGTSMPANFSIHLRDANGPFAEPFSRAIPPVVPSQAFTMSWSPFPHKGSVTIVPQLTGPNEGICVEWATLETQ
jgi:virginiamycin B lyase